MAKKKLEELESLTLSKGDNSNSNAGEYEADRIDSIIRNVKTKDI